MRAFVWTWTTLSFAFLTPLLGQERGQEGDIRELASEAEELERRLERLQEEAAGVQADLSSVRQLLQVHRELERLGSGLASLEERSAAEIRHEKEQLETQIEILHISRRLRHYTAFATEILSFLEEFSPEDARRLEQHLSPTLQASRQLSEQIRNAIPKQAFKIATMDTWLEMEAQMEQDHELLELCEELIWAIEEEEERAVRDLRDELRHTLDQAENREAVPPEHGTKEGAASPVKATWLPVPVTENELAKVKHLSLDADLTPLLKTYCIGCHSQSESSGDLDLESLLAQEPLVTNRKKWINVIEQMKHRVMPPEDADQPNETERRQLVLGLHDKIYNFDYTQVHHPGYEATRRLTHQEYDNTLSDLFGVPVQAASRFPKELSGTSGFDNSGNTLFLQPLLLERYMTAADEVVEALLPDQPESKQQKIATNQFFFVQPQSVEEETTVARSILQRFVGRAYRRPLQDEELSRLIARYEQLKMDGNKHQAALRAIVRQTLVSPNFLLKFETQRNNLTDARISDWELASRLSYFLWASMPDNELFSLAKAGTLGQPTILHEQVQRMLLDPRAKTLGSVFAAQWLGSRHIGTRVRLDPIDNPWCTDSLMTAMREETALVFHELVTQNEAIPRLIDANFTFLNQELARHYEIPGIRGPQLRRVELESTQRGGILGHGSILAVTSFPYRTSPVVRGKWILETLLGTPPPPPPPNVSEFSEDLAENRRLSVREKLERHRQSPNCNACHSEMDPLGLSLEKYDWFGRYRERYDSGRIDDVGELPDGTTFKGLQELRTVLVEERTEELARQVSTKMLSYALGRQVEYYDEPTIREILAQLKENDYRFHTLIQGIVQSYPFQFKRNPLGSDPK